MYNSIYLTLTLSLTLSILFSLFISQPSKQNWYWIVYCKRENFRYLYVIAGDTHCNVVGVVKYLAAQRLSMFCTFSEQQNLLFL